MKRWRWSKLGNMAVHFSSATVEWSTPQWLFDLLNAEFGFELDVCATPENAKCANYYTKEQDGLRQPWTGVCWCNPPYGRQIGKWVRKAYDSSKAGATVVMLLPARPDTRWWNDHVSTYDWERRQTVMHASDVRFLRGRLKFGGAANFAPFPSAVVVYRGAESAQQRIREVQV